MSLLWIHRSCLTVKRQSPCLGFLKSGKRKEWLKQPCREDTLCSQPHHVLSVTISNSEDILKKFYSDNVNIFMHLAGMAELGSEHLYSGICKWPCLHTNDKKLRCLISFYTVFPSPFKVSQCLDKASLIKINSSTLELICNSVSSSLLASHQ